MMKTLLLMLLFQVSVQLQCDKTQIKATVGGELILVCSYDTKSFLYSKKYWCRGESRTACRILMDSEGTTKTETRHRSLIIDARRRGVVVNIKSLQLDDTGVYWVGIDKMYADIMVSIHVIVSDVPVSKPTLSTLSSLEETCGGQPVTVGCVCAQGTSVRYAWYQHTQHQDILLHSLSHLDLHCGRVKKDSHYYCDVSNDISSQRSDILSVQVLLPADTSCIYAINMLGQPIYDCADRLTTSTATTLALTTCQATKTIQAERRNQSLHVNQTDQDLLQVLQSRSWTGLPLWYEILRSGSFGLLLTILFLVYRYTKATSNTTCAERQEQLYISQKSHFAR